VPPLVSVVLPVHNGGPYLAEAVGSILEQSHQRLELLLVDDHSSDEAVASLDRSDTRLRVLASPRRGVAHAFNAGWRASRGEFIARMDADDIAAPQRLQRQLELFQADPSLGITGARVEFFASEDVGVGQGNRVYCDWLNSLVRPDDIHRAMFIESPIPNPTAVFRRDVLERLNGYRDAEWPEDYDLYLRADVAGVRMAKPGEILLRWRDHPARLTRNDPRYAMEQFQRAKIHYFVRSRLPGRKLLIWGAGPTGKLTFDLLADEGVDVAGFIEVHPRRIGGHKRGKPVSGVALAAMTESFILVAVGARKARTEIRAFLEGHGRVEGQHFLFVA
jgi:glycosyltransferase involved in cell wall biosynthesis